MVNLVIGAVRRVYAAPALKPMPKSYVVERPRRHRFHGEHHVRCWCLPDHYGTFVVTLILHREVQTIYQTEKSVLR